MTAPQPQDTPVPRRHRRRRQRRRISVFGIFGELLITAGALVMLYLGWQLWWNDAVIAGQQTTEASELTKQWADSLEPSAAPVPAPDPSAAPVAPVNYGDPVVSAVATLDTRFANIWVPRYGQGWVRTISEGVDAENVLDQGSVGHYPQTQMPGEVGNFAVAAHRSAYGGGMHLIDELQLGDAIYIETADGWYTYRFRNLEYVQPSEVDVIAPVPWAAGTTPVDRLITLTTCNPLYSTAERVIAYGVFESWQPRSAGAPAEIAAEVAKAAGTEG